MRTISVISPCYNDAENLQQCYARVRALFEGPLARYRREHIFADNCSTDGSAAFLAELAAGDPDVRVIFNARNVGVLRSTFNALQAATGDATIVMMAVDLQDPPETIVQFVEAWEAGADVVHGVRIKREESAAMLFLRGGFYRLMSRISSVPVPVDVGEFQLIDARVRSFVCRNTDHHPYIRGLIADAGFKTVGVPYSYQARARGLSKNRLFGLLDIAANALLTFSRLPVRLFGAIGLLAALASLPTFAYAAIAGGNAVYVGLALLLAGLNLVATALVGEYAMMLHAQVRLGGSVPEKGRLNFPDPA